MTPGQWSTSRGSRMTVTMAWKYGRPRVPRLAKVLDEIEKQVRCPGVTIENKGVTGSLHYRLALPPDEARRELLEILAHSVLASGLRLEEGRMVLNVLPPLTVSKGSAVSWLAKE